MIKLYECDNNYGSTMHSGKDLSLIQKWLRMKKTPLNRQEAIQIVKSYLQTIDPSVVYRLYHMSI